MSKRLEQTVKELIGAQNDKKAADKAAYQATKEYGLLYDKAVAMLQSGHVMPRDSRFFAAMADEPRGSVSNAYVVQRIEENFPRLSGVIEQYRQDCREELVERLHYGKA